MALWLYVALLLPITPFIYSIYANSPIRRNGYGVLIGVGFADTVTWYMSHLLWIALQAKYAVIYLWLMREWVIYSSIVDLSLMLDKSEDGLTDKFYIIEASVGDSDGFISCVEFIKIYLALFPRDTHVLKDVIAKCVLLRMIRVPKPQILKIKYLTRAGLFSVKYDLLNDTNLTTGEDLLFGEFAIHPKQSKCLNNSQ